MLQSLVVTCDHQWYQESVLPFILIKLLLVNYLQMYFLEVGDEGAEDVSCGEEYNEISR